MNIEVSEIDGKLTHIRLSGRLDSPGVDSIETQFVAALVSPGRHGVVDLSQVSFLASMGIRMLISSGRALNLKGSKMALYGATDLVKTVLDHVALDQIIPVVATRQEAIERLG